MRNESAWVGDKVENTSIRRNVWGRATLWNDGNALLHNVSQGHLAGRDIFIVRRNLGDQFPRNNSRKRLKCVCNLRECKLQLLAGY
jgi:hypothetical protein